MFQTFKRCSGIFVRVVKIRITSCMSLESMYHHANVYGNPKPLGWECTAHQSCNAVKKSKQKQTLNK